MGIHLTQGKAQVKVQTNPLNLEQIKMNKILLMTAIGIFIVLGAGSIAVVHACIIAEFGKNQTYSDWNGGYSQNDSCPSPNSLSYCSGYTVIYDAKQGTVKQAQLGEM